MVNKIAFILFNYKIFETYHVNERNTRNTGAHRTTLKTGVSHNDNRFPNFFFQFLSY